MKVRDLRSLLYSADPDEEVFFTQERHNYAQTIDVVPVTRVAKIRCETETNGSWIVSDDNEDYEDFDEEIETKFLFIIS